VSFSSSMRNRVAFGQGLDYAALDLGWHRLLAISSVVLIVAQISLDYKTEPVVGNSGKHGARRSLGADAAPLAPYYLFDGAPPQNR